jgi:hypothetical protein
VERTVSDTHVCFQVVPLRVLLVTIQKCQCGNPVTLLHESTGFRNFHSISLGGRNLLELWNLLSFNSRAWS